MKLQDIERETLKRAVLDSGVDEEYRRAHFRAYKGDRALLEELQGRYSPEVVQVAKNLDLSDFRRKKKVFDKIDKVVRSGQAVFLTLTFNDKALSCSAKTRRRYVSFALADLSPRYVANIDYGSNTEREHYHAVVELCGCELKNSSVSFIDKDGKKRSYQEAYFRPFGIEEWSPLTEFPALAKWVEKRGFVKALVCGISEGDAKAVSKYTAKLSRHALKSSTDKEGKLVAPRLIYSRKKRKV